MNQPLSSIMSEDWAAALAPVEEQIHAMGAFLREEHAAGTVLSRLRPIFSMRSAAR